MNTESPAQAGLSVAGPDTAGLPCAAIGGRISHGTPKQSGMDRDLSSGVVVRDMQTGDAAVVSALCMAAFNAAVAATQSAEGVATF